MKERRIMFGKKMVNDGDGRMLELKYSIIVNECEECQNVIESYGCAVKLREPGGRENEEVIRGITNSGDFIYSLTECLANGVVTPCQLKEVIENILE